MASSYKTYTPAFSGFSTDPIVTARYLTRGKMVHLWITSTTDGTSNASAADSLWFQLPFPAKTAASQNCIVSIIKNNNTLQSAPGLCLLVSGSNVATVYRDSTVLTAWTASAAKSFSLELVYEADNIDVFEANDSLGVARPAIITWGQSNLLTGVTTVASDLEAPYKQTYNNVRVNQYNTNKNFKQVSMDYLDNTSYQNPDQNGAYSLQFYLYPDISTQLSRTLQVCHYGQGNTGLAVEWKSTTTIGDNYRNILFKTKQLKNAILDADGIAADFKFMMIIHGEYDSRILAYANAYEQNLTDFINNFRTQSGLTALPMIIVRLNTNTQYAVTNPLTYWATIQTAQDNVVANVSDCYIFNPDACQMHTDFTHYTVAGEHDLSDGILNVAITEGLI